MIKVLIADDHTIVRRGLKQLLDHDPRIEVVYEAQNGNEVLEFIRSNNIDVVVLDISMPGRNGLDTLKDIKNISPQIGVIILSMHSQAKYEIRCFQDDIRRETRVLRFRIYLTKRNNSVDDGQTSIGIRLT